MFPLQTPQLSLHYCLRTVTALSGSPVTPMRLGIRKEGRGANRYKAHNLHRVRRLGSKRHADPLHPICMPSCVWVFLHARLPLFDGALWDVIREWGLLSRKPSWNSQTGTQPHLTLLTRGLPACFLPKQIKKGRKESEPWGVNCGQIAMAQC